VDSLWATKSEGVGLIVHAIPRFPTYVITILHQLHGWTDGHANARPRFAL